ncbi:MAG: hypothetical protein MK132_05495 [Lentisphaerales bacterium]|nr:hypothetical protein [Lentisphaerales bacterium]
MKCAICYRERRLTKHHLIPVSRHKNKKTQKRHSKDALKSVIEICRECHNQLHATISEKDMDETYNSFTMLINHPEISKFTEWIRKHQPAGKVSVKSNRNKRSR